MVQLFVDTGAKNRGPDVAASLTRLLFLLELASDDLTRILPKKLPNFPTLLAGLCTRNPFERTDRVVYIDLYYIS